jgi:iron complex outermembrane receptor protein
MTRKSAQPWAVGIGVLLLVARGAQALAVDSEPAQAPEITVTAPRGLTVGGIAPLLELSPSELESYGADSLSDLLDALKFLTRSARSDGAPVVLINGHLAGVTEFTNLPSDAVERVEVLPETVALQYGFSEYQRVLNIVLREHYRAVPTRVSEGGATEGGDRNTQFDASLVQLNDEARVTGVVGGGRKLHKGCQSGFRPPGCAPENTRRSTL